MFESIRLKVALALFPKTKEIELTKQELDELVGTANVNSSTEAVDHIMKIFKKFNVPVVTHETIDMGTWKVHYVYTPGKNICVVFKRYWFYSLEKRFSLPKGTGEGTGINIRLFQYCLQNNVPEVFICQPSGNVWIMNISDLKDYVDTYGSVQKEKDSFEYMLPVSKLKPWILAEETVKSNVIKV